MSLVTTERVAVVDLAYLAMDKRFPALLVVRARVFSQTGTVCLSCERPAGCSMAGRTQQVPRRGSSDNRHMHASVCAFTWPSV